MEVIAVVGLGCVGLPLAVAFGKLMPTIGHDLALQKIASYCRHIYPSDTVIDSDMRATTRLAFSTDPAELARADYIIIAVPTPIDAARKPELAVIFNMLGLDTLEVLEAAGTKWNFLPFRPGLVGGHCIGVDPYYPTHKAEMLGYHPEVILAGRHINDNMGKFIAEQAVKQSIQAGSHIKGAKVHVLGITFKENVPDLRNSKVWDLIVELRAYGVEVFIHDPVADADEARQEYGIELPAWGALPPADAMIVAVAHELLLSKPHLAYIDKMKHGGCFTDVKARFDSDKLSAAGPSVWRL